MTSATSTSIIAAADVVAGYHDGRVQIGHSAATGLPVDYVARTERRLCNGLIIGGTGSGTTTLAEHIADTLRGTGGWLVRHVRADAGRDRGNELHLLTEAEHRAGRPGRHREPLHLVIWDGFAQLATDPALQAADFAGRVTALAQYGPEYGVAQLVIAAPAQLRADTDVDPDVVDTDARLRALLADNVIALRTDERSEHQLGGYLIAPTRLPREHGHALALIAEDGAGNRAVRGAHRDLVHTHLDLGRSRSDCTPCRRAANDQRDESRGESTAPHPARRPHLREGATR